MRSAKMARSGCAGIRAIIKGGRPKFFRAGGGFLFLQRARHLVAEARSGSAESYNGMGSWTAEPGELRNGRGVYVRGKGPGGSPMDQPPVKRMTQTKTSGY